ncbi:hypothetical protein CJ010_14615 [Azoarcus sp. DD4]|uniref:hypothetical protein n=1 Tax=Azoarcus sp. DD4 TaxID=2027405 RepID=UPI00112BF181|nr:hypothetical protein [Azoarcus sp. DD4]QDF97676.1 hypothetical protein CJ010_14615 [Azoarcus sp. DD4]
MKSATLAALATLTLFATTTQAADPNNNSECKALKAQIKRIDEAARKNSTEYLTEQRRQAVKRFNELGCSNFD